MKKYSWILALVVFAYGCRFGSSVSPKASVHLTLGNPTNAHTSEQEADNYLLVKPQYVLSYNKSKGRLNWVSWELSRNWLGEAERQDDFRPDDSLPKDWVRVTTSDYTGSGFDRGHLCPSADRTSSTADNSSTFAMTNIAPQAPELNRESWAYVEDFCRDVVKKGYKAFVVAGAYGSGGEGSLGKATIIKNKVQVPERYYKVVVFYKEGQPIGGADTHVLALDFPNASSAVKNQSWLRFITTPDEIERRAGVAFFSALAPSLQSTFRKTRFDYLNSTFDIDAVCRLYNGRPLYIGTRGGCYYLNASGNKTYVDRAECGCS